MRLDLFVLLTLAGCSTSTDLVDGRDDSFTTNGKADGLLCTPEEAAAILGVANTASKATLKNDVALADKAIDNILAYRAGDDEQTGTNDDETFGSLGELDAVPFIGPAAFQKLLAFVHDADLVPASAPRQWRARTVANGADADMTVAPNGAPVAVFRVGSLYKVLLPDGSQADLPSDASVGPPQVAVDGDQIPHVFYRPSFGAPYKHASLRNGAWSQHVPITAKFFRVDQGPAGEIFAFENHVPTDAPFETLFTLYTIAADGSTAAEPLWDGDFQARERFDGGFDVNVDADGLPSLVWRHRSGTIRNAWRSPSGWQTRDTKAQLFASRTAVTTGGENAVVFVESSTSEDVLRVLRVQGTTVVDNGKTPLDARTGGMDTVLEPDGTAHVCAIVNSSIIHLQVDTTGNVTKQTLGSADTCWLGLDAAGTLHLMFALGNVINHATYE